MNVTIVGNTFAAVKMGYRPDPDLKKWLEDFLQNLPDMIDVDITANNHRQVPKQEITGVHLEITISIDGWRDEWDNPPPPKPKAIATCSKCGAEIFHAELFRGPVCPKCGCWC